MAKFLDPEKARALFIYSPESGEMKLRKARGVGGRCKKGSTVGGIHECGPKNSKKHYLRTRFDGAFVYVHRLAYVIMTGEQPQCIDHIDGNGLNNKWTNLRSVSQNENGKNQKVHKTNTSGNRGVYFRKDSNKWRARITVDDKSINLGTFKDKQDAINARIDAEIKYGFRVKES